MTEYREDAPVVEQQPQGDAVLDVGTGAESVDDVATQTLQSSYGEGTEERVEEPKEENWEHKYRVLQGKYDKEVPRLNKELKRLRKENADLLRRIELLELMIAQQASASTPQSSGSGGRDEDADPEIEKLRQEFPEVYAAVEKLLNKKLSTAVNKIEEVKTQVEKGNFFSRLDAEVPDWRELNSDPDFLDWLKEIDENTGFKRHDLLLLAYQKGDVPTVAKFFKAFKEKEAMSKSSPAPAVKGTAPVSRQSSAPTRASEVNKKMWKESEIREFYKMAAVGRISPSEYEKVDAEIRRAALENRILYGR